MMKRSILFFALALSAISTTSALAEADLGCKSLGVAVGFVGPEDIDGTFSIGAFMDHGTITPQISLESRLDYWGQSESSTFMGITTEASVRDIAVGARGKYNFTVSNPKVQPYLGMGLGIHFVHFEATMPTFPGEPETTIEDSSTKLGLDLGGGISTPIAPRTDLLGELWYGIVSDVNQLNLRVGVSYALGS
jgi:opacity protein-like surface antigen